METIKRVNNIGRGLTRFVNDLAIWERQTKSGRTSFAIANDHGGREFPEFYAEGPMRILKQQLAFAVRGARILGRSEFSFVVCSRDSWLQAVSLGAQCTPATDEAILASIRGTTRHHGKFSACFEKFQGTCTHPNCR